MKIDRYRSFTRPFGALLMLAIFAVAVCTSAQDSNLAVKSPPKTRTDDVVEKIHGVEIADPYRWLEDQQAPETRHWIDEENAYTRSVLDALPSRDKIGKRFAELLRVTTIGTPSFAGGRYFISKREADQNQAVFYVRQGLDGNDQVLLDPNKMSADNTISVSPLDISEDGAMLAYGIRQGGEDETTLQLMNVSDHQDMPDHLPRARYSGVSVKPDHSGLYYTRFTAEGPRVYYHSMGSNPASDEEIFGKGFDRRTIIGSSLSSDGRYLLLVVAHGSAATKVEVYYQNLAKKTAIEPLVNDIEAAFSPTFAGDSLLLQTNWNAPNWRVLKVDLNDPSRNKWREIVPQGDVAITGLAALGGKVLVNYLHDVKSEVNVFDLNGKPAGEIKLPGPGTLGGLSGKWDRNEMFYSFSSFIQPPTTYRYDLATGKQSVWSTSQVPFKGDRYEVKQVWYPSKDGAKIPMFVVHAKGLKLDGSNPAFVTGYGGFNLNRTSSFSASIAFWIENGGVFAQPNLRGGGEFGEKWHHAGMLEKKQNVFDDFVAAAEWLIANKYTSPSKLAISGGSNGGLLVGAAMTQRPDLYQAVVCSFPLLDMIRYHKFLVAPFWIPEYGSSDDPGQFQYIYAYSPYHHVKKGTKYPAVLFVTGDSDTRVAPLHARKMAARMQASTGSDRPILLHYDTKAGHSGGTPVSKQIEDSTDTYSFLFWQLGMKP